MRLCDLVVLKTKANNAKTVVLHYPYCVSHDVNQDSLGHKLLISATH